MSKDKIADYDGATAGNNTDIGGISIAEGMLPSAVNNSMRELTRQLGAFADGTEGIDVLNLHDDDASASIKIQAPATVTTTTTFTLPDGDGTSGYALVTNGSGQLSWASAGGIANVADDTTPALGGDLDLNSNDITGTGNVNITGTLTADGLTVDGASTFVNFTSSNNSAYVRLQNSVATGGYIGYQNDDLQLWANASYKGLMLDGATNDISFYDSTGTTQGFFWDASTQRLGLGTTSPRASALDLGAGTGDGTLSNTPSDYQLILEANASDTGDIGRSIGWATGAYNVSAAISSYDAGTGITNGLVFATANNGTLAERLRITSDGSVGIGVSSPSGKLHLSESGATNQAATIFSLDGYHSTFGANLAKSSGTYTTPAVSLSGGGWEYQPVNSLNNHGVMIYLSAPDTNTSASTPLERLRIDGDGNFMCGKTAVNVATAGVEARSDGLIAASRSASTPMFVNRLSDDGTLLNFRKDNVTVGSVESDAGRIRVISEGSLLLRQNDTTQRNIVFSSTYFGTDTAGDATVDLGRSAGRFKNGYFSGTVYADQFLGQNDTNTGIAVGGNDVIQLSTGGSERARVTSTGQFLVGQTTNQAHLNTATGDGLTITQSGEINQGTTGESMILNRRGSDGIITRFRREGNTIGSINVTASGTTYNTTSDIRLKENIEPLVATDKLMAMNPVSYNWKADPNGPRSMGFIAQEMQEVMPEAVSTGDDEDAMMSMDYGRITPILVSALQDAHRKIEELAAEIAELKGAK